MSRNKHYGLIGLLVIITCMTLTISLAEAEVGTGQLYVYTDTWGGTEAEKGGPNGDTYFVKIDVTYYIRVWGITEFNKGDLLTVKICWTMHYGMHDYPQTTFIYDVAVEEDFSGVKYADVTWTVPALAKISTNATVHYADYVAAGQVSNIGYMHIITELLLGTIGGVLALFGGLSIHKRWRTRGHS